MLKPEALAGATASAAVCDDLGIDRSTLSRWVASGRITPIIKLPGTRGPFLFNPDDVARLKAEIEAAKTGNAA